MLRTTLVADLGMSETNVVFQLRCLWSNIADLYKSGTRVLCACALCCLTAMIYRLTTNKHFGLNVSRIHASVWQVRLSTTLSQKLGQLFFPLVSGAVWYLASKVNKTITFDVRCLNGYWSIGLLGSTNVSRSTVSRRERISLDLRRSETNTCLRLLCLRSCGRQWRPCHKRRPYSLYCVCILYPCLATLVFDLGRSETSISLRLRCLWS